MAKKIKFPLVMRDDAEVRTMEELKEHFDIEKAVGYFLDGKLLSWLEARYYDTEADAVHALDKNDAELRKKLCGIFGAEYNEEEIASLDVEEAEERSRKLSKLRQYTSDQTILDKVDSVAFDQEDLADLLDNDVHDIYLCNNSFVIPLRVEDKKYIGIGKAEAVIKSEEFVSFADKKIVFENVPFDAKYQRVYEESPVGLDSLGSQAEYTLHDYRLAMEYYQKAAAKGNIYSMQRIAEKYKSGDENFQITKAINEAIYWYTKAADLGDANSMELLGTLYADGDGVVKDEAKARYWIEKAAINGETSAMLTIGKKIKNGTWGYEANFERGLEWIVKAANLGNYSAIQYMGDLYAGEYVQNSPPQDIEKSLAWYKKSIEVQKEFEKQHGISSDSMVGTILETIGNHYACGRFGEGERIKAVDWYKKALELKDYHCIASAACCIARFYFDENCKNVNLDEALKYYKKSLEHGYDFVAREIGDVYAAKGNNVEAIRWYEKYLNSNPEYYVDEYKEKLQKMKSK